jgi:hypothetical protein
MKNGGIIGTSNNTSKTTASGVWSLKEQYSSIKNSRWPEFVRPNARSLLFNSVSTDGYVEIPSVPQMENISTLTLEAWVNRTGNGASNFPVIVGKSGLAADYQLIYRNSTFEIDFRHEFTGTGGTGLIGAWAVTMPPDGQWYHVAVTFDVSSLNSPIFYINGALHESGYRTVSTPTGNPVYSNGSVTIGSRDLGIRGFYGYIDEVRIWNKIKTPQEIQAEYNKTIKPNSEGLVGYWSFEEGSGLSTEDATGNSNGTLVGDVLFSTENPGI